MGLLCNFDDITTEALHNTNELRKRVVTVRKDTQQHVVTFRVRRSRGEMYSGDGRLCVCVPRRIPTLLHGPGCNLGGMVGGAL